VLSTTRQADRPGYLRERGVDHPLLDTGEVAPAVRELYPDGVDAALDLVGTPTLPDTLRAVRVHGLLRRQPLQPVHGAGLRTERVPGAAPSASSSSASGTRASGLREVVAASPGGRQPSALMMILAMATSCA
jgi:hypothetical protein